MNHNAPRKNTGGIAPFGYRWQNRSLVVDESEAPVRKLIYELFLKHRRKKTVAKLLTSLGYRTRTGAQFSDTTIGRLLRDTTAKGIREVEGVIVEVRPLVDVETWEEANRILGDRAPTKQTLELFTGIAFCCCGGKMYVPSNSAKYTCRTCRRKILIDDLEAVFRAQLKSLTDDDLNSIHDLWVELTSKDKRLVIEQICNRVVVESDTIQIEFAYSLPSSKLVADGQQIGSAGGAAEETSPAGAVAAINGPLLSEADAARFLGVSKMTVLRKRNAGEIGFFRVGYRVLYSKEKHLFPFLHMGENGT